MEIKRDKAIEKPETKNHKNIVSIEEWIQSAGKSYYEFLSDIKLDEYNCDFSAAFMTF